MVTAMDDNKFQKNLRLAAGIAFALVLLFIFLFLPSILDFISHCIKTVYDSASVPISNIASILPPRLVKPVPYFFKFLFVILLLGLIVTYISAIAIAPTGMRGNTFLRALSEIFNKRKE